MPQQESGNTPAAGAPETWVCGLVVEGLRLNRPPPDLKAEPADAAEYYRIDSQVRILDTEDRFVDLTSFSAIGEYISLTSLTHFSMIEMTGSEHTVTSSTILKDLEETLDALVVFFGGSPQIVAEYKMPDVFSKRMETLTWPSGAFAKCRAHITPFQGEMLLLDPADEEAFRRFWRNWAQSGEFLKFVGREHRSVSAQPTIPRRVALLVQSLESLLGNATQDLGYKVALRGAYALEPRLERRQYLRTILTKCYDLRSKVVHGSKREEIATSEKSLREAAAKDGTLEELLADLEARTRRLMRAYVLCGVEPQRARIEKIDEGLLTGADSAVWQSMRSAEIQK